MNILAEYTDIHIELTDKCQASCPMCARNYHGGIERPFVGQNEITLEKFKSWFSPQDLKHLKNFYACGNYGDPIIAQDCLEIFQYIRQHNSLVRLGIHTNGSARSKTWWANLAHALGNNHEVTFGIDGFANSHVLYRRGTDWNKIIDNARAFIDAGGYATIDSLVFKHNEHETVDFEKAMLDIGFAKINFKSTARFYDMKEFPVEDKNGNYEYSLYPAETTEFKKIAIIKLEEVAADITQWESQVSKTNVSPKCINRKEIYIDASGDILPCCWVGSDWVEQPIKEKLTIQQLRNKMIVNTKDKFSMLGIFNLDNARIQEQDWSNLNDIVTGANKPWICAKNCNE
jgi:MoaA/NifB/PqqE/SkfB family radical SAM enzyme